MASKPIKRVTGGKTRWVARAVDPRTGKHVIAKPAWNGGRGTFDTKKLATKAIEELEGGSSSSGPDITVRAYFERWLVDHPRVARTADTYRRKVRVSLETEIEGVPLGDWKMRELRRRHGREWIGQQYEQHGRSFGGMQTHRRSLSAMFTDAIDDELADLNPFERLNPSANDPRIRKAQESKRVWTREQIEEFLTVTGDWLAFYRTLTDCGLRLGEAFALLRTNHRDGWLFLEEGSAWRGEIQPQGVTKKHKRPVPTTAALEAALRARATRIDTAYLFPTVTGKIWREQNWREDVHKPIIEAARRDIGIDPTPRELRRSYVSELRAAGIDPADLASYSGHSVETANRNYVQALGRSADDVRKALGG